MKLRFIFAATLVAATLAGTAWAQGQPWIQDRRYGEGIGIRTGNLELHPGVAGEIGYDSNYFQRSGGTPPGEEIIDVYRLRLTPSLSLSTLSPQRRQFDEAGAAQPAIEFDGGVSASYNEVIAVDGENSDAARKQRDISAGADFNLEILPHKPWGGYLEGDFLRTVEPSNDPDQDSAMDRDALRLGAGVAWRPGGGLFDWRLGYEFRYNYFEADNYTDNNNVHHYVTTKGRWKFLPRTALVYDASLGFIRYANSGLRNNSSPVRSRIGLTGLVTTHFGFLAMVGWGASFYESTAGTPVQDYDSVIGQGEIKWYLQPQQKLAQDAARVGLSTIAAGYIRNFRDSYLSDYYQYDRVYGKFDYFFAGVMLISAEAGYARYYFPTPYFPGPGADDRDPPGGPYTQNRVDAKLFAEYRLSDTFGINTTFRYDANLTQQDVQVQQVAPPPPAVPAPPDELEFSRYQIFIGARWFM